MADDIPTPIPRPPEAQIAADIKYSDAMRKIAALLTTPPQGRPLLGPNGDVEGPLNITPNPIYYPNSSGWIGPPRK